MAPRPLTVCRTNIELDPDLCRVVIRPFLPDARVFPDGGLLERILAMPESEVAATLKDVLKRFCSRHRDVEAVLMRHYCFVADEAELLLHNLDAISHERRLLIGAFYSEEYAIEAAALTNPSIVVDPDQTGIADGSKRFILSLRCIGEGQTSSIVFRCGVIDAEGAVTIEPIARFVNTGVQSRPPFTKTRFRQLLTEMKAYDVVAQTVMETLGDVFTLRELNDSIARVESVRAPRRLSNASLRAIHLLATSNYYLTFNPDSPISERILFAGSPSESHGLEDARFVRFTDDDGSVTYYATYTAYSGVRILPQLIQTDDFVSFRVSTLTGKTAQNKGASLFPRKINGQFVALSRFDAENNYVMRTDDVRRWGTAKKIQIPEYPWELARIGNCGSPHETDAGWLVITHGVGPMRTYSIGAMLLDIEDPTKVLGRLVTPLLVALESERDGYVPNVVYSCGSMIHGDELILPYGQADRTTRIARVPLAPLLQRLAMP